MITLSAYRRTENMLKSDKKMGNLERMIEDELFYLLNHYVSVSRADIDASLEETRQGTVLKITAKCDGIKNVGVLPKG